jgi:hypothetical protein
MIAPGTQLKELLTKTFWQGVKKTYDDALKGPPQPEIETPAIETPAVEPIPEPHPEPLPPQE